MAKFRTKITTAFELRSQNMSQFLCSSGDKKMAESKGSLLAKSVSKHAGRAKEKVI